MQDPNLAHVLNEYNESKRLYQELHDKKHMWHNFRNMYLAFGKYLEQFRIIFMHNEASSTRMYIDNYLRHCNDYITSMGLNFHIANQKIAGNSQIIDADQGYIVLQNDLLQASKQYLIARYESGDVEQKMHAYTRAYDKYIAQIIRDNAQKKSMQIQLESQNAEYDHLVADFIFTMQYLPKKLREMIENIDQESPQQESSQTEPYQGNENEIYTDTNIRTLKLDVKPYPPNKNGHVNFEIAPVLEHYFKDIIYVLVVAAITQFNEYGKEKLVVTGGNALERMYNLKYWESSFDWDLHIINQDTYNINAIMDSIDHKINGHIRQFSMYIVYLNNCITNINNYFKSKKIDYVIQPYDQSVIQQLPGKKIFTSYTRSMMIHSHKMSFICNGRIQHIDITDVEYDDKFRTGDTKIYEQDCHKVGSVLYISLVHITKALIQLACTSENYRKMNKVLARIYFLRKNLLSDIFDCGFINHLQKSNELNNFKKIIQPYMESKQQDCRAISGDFVEKSIMYICNNIKKITNTNPSCGNMFLSTNQPEHIPEHVQALVDISNDYIIHKCPKLHSQQECAAITKLIRLYCISSNILNKNLSKYYYSQNVKYMHKEYSIYTVQSYTDAMNYAIQKYHNYSKFHQFHDQEITVYKSCRFFNVPLVNQNTYMIGAGDNIYQPCFNSTSYSKRLKYNSYMDDGLPFYVMQITLRLGDPCYIILDKISPIPKEKEILLKNNIVFHVDRVSYQYIEQKREPRQVIVLHISIIKPRENMEYINPNMIQIDDNDGSESLLYHRDKYIDDITRMQIMQPQALSPDFVFNNLQVQPHAIAAFRAYHNAKKMYLHLRK